MNVEINPSEYKVLIVDDVISNVLLLKVLLTNEKFNIVTAGNGTQALEQVKKEKPDLVLLDVMMPDISGFEVAQQMKADEEMSEIPVIFLTALNSTADIVKGFQVGGNDFISKPFNKEELIIRVTHQISLVAAMAAINNMLRQYGAADPIFGQAEYAQIPMAVVGIVMKFFQIIISVVVGMAAGCIPIVGFNMGARHLDRVRALFTRLLLAEAAVGAVGFVLAEFFPRQLISIFGAANESSYYTDFALRAFRVYLCLIILACVNKACFIFLQAMGKAAESTAPSMVREVVFGVGFALLLPRFFGLDGVLYSMPVSDLLTFLIALVLIRQTYKELGKKEKSV